MTHQQIVRDEMNIEKEKDLKIKLLQMEIDALRSVISEFNQEDLNCYTQWLKAEAISNLLNHIRG